MKIYLVRHGEALPPDIDPQKGLSPQGRADVGKIARTLGQHSFPLTVIYHSEKLRAKQTAEIFQECVAPQAPLVLLHHMNPNDPIDEVVERIEMAEGDCMFVGHLPFLEEVCLYLGVGRVSFGPGTCVCLESRDDHWIMTTQK